ncbi:MAG: FlgD immunoglobulin-like domain containing protein, partial [Gemmatimonadota bacterium]
AMGHLHGPNPERGVYRTTDGGETWEKVLYIDERIGVIDLVMVPGRPDVLYAATYEKERLPWTYGVGGPGSGVYRTTDGGDHWTRLTNGLPTEGRIGRIGIDVFRGDPGILYAVVENANLREGDEPGSMRVSGGRGEVYRSDDAGETWRMTHDPEINVGGKAPYSFNILRIDPEDPDRVYVASDAMLITEDGGETWTGGYGPNRTDRFRRMFGDIRILWIDPGDPRRIFVGSDGGVNITYDRGRTVDFLPSLPIGEVYGIAVDMDDPYGIYAGLQDHDSWRGVINDFAGEVSGIESWVTVGGGDGMYQAADPTDSRWVYNTLQFGGHVRTDRENATMTRIQPRRPEGEEPYRFTWTAPLVLSPHDPKVLYTAAEVVLRSPDRGDTWYELSPDLTTNDPSKINGAGNIQYCTITTLNESPAARGVIWAGTDDGRAHVTRDDGEHWNDVTAALEAAGFPSDYWVTRVVPSHHNAGTAFVTVTGFHRDDFRPFVFRTDDYGASWRALTGGLPDAASANVLREDRRSPSLLFLGTDHGLFTSLDGGERWQPFQADMPIVPVRDVAIHPRENDLVVGTHGRGLFVTDITPLQQLAGAGEVPGAEADEILGADVHFFAPEPKGRRVESAWGSYRLFGHRQVVTPNEPNGVLLDVYRAVPGDTAVLIITDRDGGEVRTLDVPPEAGLHRVVWDLRDPDRRPVPPGEYTVTLRADGRAQSRPVVVKPPVVVPRG